MRLLLKCGGAALIDAADMPLVAGMRWRRFTVAKTYHYVATVGRRPVLLHRFLMQPAKGMVVDHMNGDPMDNRRQNLRVCTHAENMQNRRRATNSEAPYKGVARRKNKRRWQAHIGGNSAGAVTARRVIGRFDTAEDAALAYDIAAIRLYGEFACVNFPHVFPELNLRKA